MCGKEMLVDEMRGQRGQLGGAVSSRGWRSGGAHKELRESIPAVSLGFSSPAALSGC